MPRQYLEEGKNGRDCMVTGIIMWEAHQDSNQCKNYGTKQFGKGFMVSVNYTYGCDNRDSVLPSIGTIGRIQLRLCALVHSQIVDNTHYECNQKLGIGDLFHTSGRKGKNWIYISVTRPFA